MEISIIVNACPYKVCPYALAENSLFFKNYFSGNWGQTPITIEHPFLEIGAEHVAVALTSLETTAISSPLSDEEYPVLCYLFTYLQAEQLREELLHLALEIKDKMYAYLCDPSLATTLSNEQFCQLMALGLYPALEKLERREIVALEDYLSYLETPTPPPQTDDMRILIPLDEEEVVEDSDDEWPALEPEWDEDAGDASALPTVETPTPAPALTPRRCLVPSREGWQERYQAVTGGLLDNLDWDHVVLAGGSLLLLLDPELPLPPSSDLDLFVWGETEEKRWATVRRVVASLPANRIIFRNGSVLTVLFPHSHRHVQIIENKRRSPTGVLSPFDHTAVMVAYTGSELLCMPSFLHSWRSRCSTFPYAEVQLPRIWKIMHKGFSALVRRDAWIEGKRSYRAKDLRFSAIEEDSTVLETKEKYLHITTEPVHRVAFLVKKIFSRKYSLVTDEATLVPGAYTPYGGKKKNSNLHLSQESRREIQSRHGRATVHITHLLCDDASRATFPIWGMVQCHIREEQRLSLVIIVEASMVERLREYIDYSSTIPGVRTGAQLPGTAWEKGNPNSKRTFYLKWYARSETEAPPIYYYNNRLASWSDVDHYTSYAIKAICTMRFTRINTGLHSSLCLQRATISKKEQ